MPDSARLLAGILGERSVSDGEPALARFSELCGGLPLALLDRDRFAASFAADVPEKPAAFMADSQVPWGVEALEGAVSEPAWQSKPSWYLVATDDRMIPPAAQRAMSERAGATVSETPGSHAVYVSRPAVVAAVIAQAAQGLNGQA
ncbi:alpha/beta hydrolase [Streptomyces sp. NPDC002599]|uniref:alpha/beta hydrolase n=1 Tax=Streptomyces sp. NPDC002599 TaxID=3154421 RepID=UPI00331FE2F0